MASGCARLRVRPARRERLGLHRVQREVGRALQVDSAQARARRASCGPGRGGSAPRSGSPRPAPAVRRRGRARRAASAAACMGLLDERGKTGAAGSPSDVLDAAVGREHHQRAAVLSLDEAGAYDLGEHRRYPGVAGPAAVYAVRRRSGIGRAAFHGDRRRVPGSDRLDGTGSAQGSRSSTCASPSRYRGRSPRCTRRPCAAALAAARDLLLVADEPAHGVVQLLVRTGGEVAQLHLGQHLLGQRRGTPRCAGVPSVTCRAEERCRDGPSARISGSRSSSGEPGAAAPGELGPEDVDTALEQPPYVAQVRLVLLGAAQQRPQLGQPQRRRSARVRRGVRAAAARRRQRRCRRRRARAGTGRGVAGGRQATGRTGGAGCAHGWCPLHPSLPHGDESGGYAPRVRIVPLCGAPAQRSRTHPDACEQPAERHGMMAAMRAVVQRVDGASVVVDGETVGEIVGEGLCVLVGVTHEDTDGEGGAARPQAVVGAHPGGREVLLGHRSAAAGDQPVHALRRRPQGPPPHLERGRTRGRSPSRWSTRSSRSCGRWAPTVETGRFGAEMRVSLTNDGPFTVLLEV